MKVIKRNGTVVDFNADKIKIAIEKAKKEVKSEVDVNSIMDLVLKTLGGVKSVAVELIQDTIFDSMVMLGESKLARDFERYRTRRTVEREKKLEKIYNDMHSVLVSGSNENSNKDSRLHGVTRDLVAGEFFRNTLSENIPKEVYDAHRKKLIHWHDSDYSTHQTNCCVFNLSDMLENGTKILNAEIESPKSIQVATNVAMQIMANISAVQYGGVSLANFNETLGKYAKLNFRKHFIDVYRIIEGMPKEKVEKEMAEWEREFGKIDSGNKNLKDMFERAFKEAIEKTDKDIYDSCQLFEYQTNSILGSASQTPFSTITFNIPTSWESERIIWNYLQVRMKGLGKEGRIAIFPKISMIVVDGYNLKKEDKYYYLLQEASKCIAKTYYPDLLLYSPKDYLEGSVYARMG